MASQKGAYQSLDGARFSAETQLSGSCHTPCCRSIGWPLQERPGIGGRSPTWWLLEAHPLHTTCLSRTHNGTHMRKKRREQQSKPFKQAQSNRRSKRQRWCAGSGMHTVAVVLHRVHACLELLPGQGVLKLHVVEFEIRRRVLPALSTSNDGQFCFSVPQV